MITVAMAVARRSPVAVTMALSGRSVVAVAVTRLAAVGVRVRESHNAKDVDPEPEH